MNLSMQQFPKTRLRRNRSDKWLRDLLHEHHIHAADLILPIFIQEGKKKKDPIKKLPDIYRYSIDLALEEVAIAKKLGIKAIAVFPVVEQSLKTKDAKESCNENNLICRAIKQIKQIHPEIGIIADVALDPYNLDGHDGVVINSYVDNDKTLEILARQAVTLAKAGADIIAPSDMMDGRVGHLREALDKQDFINVKILAYSVKYLSSFYGPFRDAIGSDINLKDQDKSSYQMDFSNRDEAVAEVEMDINEGADMIIIKPALCYLDIIRSIKDKFNISIFAYQVSGEYAMLKAAGDSGYLDYKKVMFESLIACKRAGATAILCYDAINIVTHLKQKQKDSSYQQ
jgi:porphobilinogen synthase